MINEVDKETTDIFKWECKIPGKVGVSSVYFKLILDTLGRWRISALYGILRRIPLETSTMPI